MNRAIKIRIYPDKEQSVQIEKTIGCSRFIYNQMLADKILIFTARFILLTLAFYILPYCFNRRPACTEQTEASAVCCWHFYGH